MTSRSKDPTVRNVFVLAICQALTMSCQSLLITISAIVGTSLAADPRLGTLPLSLQFLAVMLTTLPASFLMKRYGRRFGFSIGALAGIAGGLISMQAVFQASFWMLCLGAVLFGVFAGFSLFYRFAAADTASPAFKSRAISLVLAGGVLAGVLGPEIAKHGREFFSPVLFAGSYLAAAGLAALAVILLRFIRIPPPSGDERHAKGRPFIEIAAQPSFLVAVGCGVVAYGVMNLLMVSTPLAMIACAHPFESAASVIQAHVIALYLPSFFTGSLIQRFGMRPILATGALLLLACVGVNLHGDSIAHFVVSLVFLGLGWNLLYVGGSTLLTDTHRPEEKAKVQAANEFIIFGSVAVTAFSSGALHAAVGWEAMNLLVVVPILLAMFAALRFGKRPVPAQI